MTAQAEGGLLGPVLTRQGRSGAKSASAGAITRTLNTSKTRSVQRTKADAIAALPQAQLLAMNRTARTPHYAPDRSESLFDSLETSARPGTQTGAQRPDAAQFDINVTINGQRVAPRQVSFGQDNTLVIIVPQPGLTQQKFDVEYVKYEDLNGEWHVLMSRGTVELCPTRDRVYPGVMKLKGHGFNVSAYVHNEMDALLPQGSATRVQLRHAKVTPDSTRQRLAYCVSPDQAPKDVWSFKYKFATPQQRSAFLDLFQGYGGLIIRQRVPTQPTQAALVPTRQNRTGGPPPGAHPLAALPPQRPPTAFPPPPDNVSETYRRDMQAWGRNIVEQSIASARPDARQEAATEHVNHGTGYPWPPLPRVSHRYDIMLPLEVTYEVNAAFFKHDYTKDQLVHGGLLSLRPAVQDVNRLAGLEHTGRIKLMARDNSVIFRAPLYAGMNATRAGPLELALQVVNPSPPGDIHFYGNGERAFCAICLEFTDALHMAAFVPLFERLSGQTVTLV